MKNHSKKSFRLMSLVLAALLMLSACGKTEPAASSSSAESSSGNILDGKGPAHAEAANLAEDIKAQPVEGLDADEAFRKVYLDFATAMFRQVYADEKKSKTTLVSPLSAMLVLAMAANGAEGETLAQMEQALSGGTLSLEQLNRYLYSYLSALPVTEMVRFSFADSIWIRDLGEEFTVKTDFLQKNADYYQAEIYRAPFDETTIRDVNQWVALHTDDMIKEIMDKIDPLDLMYLINAIVFDAQWMTPFPNTAVRDGTFTSLSGVTETVPMMHAQEHFYVSDDTCTGFMKLYGGKAEYRFVALLPNEDEDFHQFVASLDAEKLSALLTGATVQDVNIKLPQFSYDFETDLLDFLTAAGMTRAFTDVAQFDGISADQGLKISGVMQKTHIEVDNAGTRAAAVTAMTMAATAMLPTDPKFVYLDRPFVYLIVDSENMLPIFIGTVTEIK